MMGWMMPRRLRRMRLSDVRFWVGRVDVRIRQTCVPLTFLFLFFSFYILYYSFMLIRTI